MQILHFFWWFWEFSHLKLWILKAQHKNWNGLHCFEIPTINGDAKQTFGYPSSLRGSPCWMRRTTGYRFDGMSLIRFDGMSKCRSHQVSRLSLYASSSVLVCCSIAIEPLFHRHRTIVPSPSNNAGGMDESAMGRGLSLIPDYFTSSLWQRLTVIALRRNQR